jgi:anti-anti-sigma regulatory factor
LAQNILRLYCVDPDGFLSAAVVGNITGLDLRRNGPSMMESIAGVDWRSTRMMLDFSHCEHIDSNAIGWLIEMNKQFKEARGMLVMHSLSVNVERAFKLLRLETVLTLAPDQSAAAALFPKRGPGPGVTSK